MTKSLKALVCLALSFAFCFLTVGYAALSDNLKITGKAEISIPEGLFITDVQRVGNANNLDNESVSFVQYSTTVDTTLNRKSSYWNQKAGSVTYSITVFNNTNLEYAYRGLYYQPKLDNYNGNSSVSTSNSNNSIGVVCSLASAGAQNRKVAPGGTLTFQVTYTIGKNMSDVDYRNLINFQFGINLESEEAARDAVYRKFADILNTDSTYETLSDAIDNKFDGVNEWTSNYIGNVGSATSDDAVVVNTLFAGQLQMIINGVTKPASVIIKHEDLDGNKLTGDDYVARNTNNNGVFRGYGCEMTLYFTVDSLNNANGNANVYVAVFTCDRDAEGNIISDWYMVGDTYYGTANVVGYNGESGGTGSFVTDNWVARGQNYQVTEDYRYNVPNGTTIKTLVQTVDNSAIREYQSLLTRAKAMIDDLTYAGTGIDVVEKAYANAMKHCTLDADGNPVANAGTTRAQLIILISDLDHALVEAQKAIDALPKS